MLVPDTVWLVVGQYMTLYWPTMQPNPGKKYYQDSKKIFSILSIFLNKSVVLFPHST